MRLKVATILVIIGAVTTFLFRVTGALSPIFFSDTFAQKTFVIISLFSFLTIVAFFILFFFDFTQKGQRLLKTASILMIIGSTAITVLFLKVLFSVFKVFPSIYYYAKPGFLEVLFPFISSAFTLFFFSVFYKEMKAKFGFHLKLAVILAIVSSVITFALKSVVLVNYYSQGELSRALSVLNKYPVIIILLSVFWVFTSLYFYITFYRELD